MEENEVVVSLAALAQSLRLRVFRALVVAGSPGMTPGVLSESLAVPATTLSFHLKELTHAGLVSQERDGRNLIYRASYGRMNALLACRAHGRELPHLRSGSRRAAGLHSSLPSVGHDPRRDPGAAEAARRAIGDLH